jgi:hypothetical protein
LSHSRPIGDEITDDPDRRVDSLETTSMEEQMRLTRFVPATLTICLVTLSLTVRVSDAANDCITKPNAAPPQGSHWYYRVDRATHRECWYLGAEGTKVHPPVRQAVSPVRSPAPKPTSQSTAQAPTEATTDAPGEITAGGARAPQGDTTATLSVRWADLPTSPTLLDRAPLSMSNGYAEEPPAMASEEDMPLIWPILTPAELAAGERAPGSTIAFAQLAAALAAVLGLAALIVRMLVRLSSARKPDRPNAHKKSSAAAYRHIAHRTAKATRDPAAEIEASVRRLLQELQQRRHQDLNRLCSTIDARMQPA